MTTGLDSLLRPLVAGILADPFLGATFTLYRPDTANAFISSTATQQTAQLGPYTVKGAPISGFSPATEEGGEETFRETEARTFIAAADPGLPSGVTVEEGWTLVDASKRWRVHRVEPARSGDLVAGYTLILRGKG